MSRLFAMVSYSSGRYEKQAQLVGFILSSISHTPENLASLKRFEKQLMLISFNDESLSPITAGILYSLNNPPNEQEDPNSASSFSKKEELKQDPSQPDNEN